MVYGSLATEVATLALAIGLVLALTCYLLTNLSPGGMITPGWIALTVVEDTRKMFVIIAVTALTYGGTHLLQRVVILYGKRLFAAVTMISVLLSTALFLVIHNDYPLLFVHETLGFIIPGLVAYQLHPCRFVRRAGAVRPELGEHFRLAELVGDLAPEEVVGVISAVEGGGDGFVESRRVDSPAAILLAKLRILGQQTESDEQALEQTGADRDGRASCFHDRNLIAGVDHLRDVDFFQIVR